MKKTGIFYGSATGNTADVARMIAGRLGVDTADVHDVAATAPSALGDYDNLVLGSSTWGSGDLEDNWYDFIAGAEVIDLKGKKIAVFGCGDETMYDTFCDAVGQIYDRMAATGATMTGHFNADGYDFGESKSYRGGAMVGLTIDQGNHPELTEKRVEAWCEQLKKEFD